ncbi:MAG TPA: GNAT family N-acetyltransferase [Candidatus Krumholzibacteria bacterium]
MSVEVIRYDPSLKEELVDFRRVTYETGFPESRDYLDWKYEQNPYIGETLFYIARAGGRIIGMRGMYGTKWECGRERDAVVLPCADDFVVDPEHRNSGVVTLIMRDALADLARRGYDYVLNTSGGRITVMSSLAAGWRSAGAVEPMVRRSTPERARQVVRARVRRVPGLWRLARSKSANLISSPEPFRRVDAMGRVATPTGGSIVAETMPRVAAMALLVERLPYDGRIRHVRDAEYLAWRYRNPIRQYRFFYYEHEGRVDGYLVLARYIECQLPTLPFHIVDWEGASDSIRAELLQCATRVARIAELGTWAAGLSEADRAHLARAGFEPADMEMRKRGMPCILVKSLRGAAPESWSLHGTRLLDPARWDPRLVYTMHG